METSNPEREAIRQAIASRQFPLAERLWTAYMTRLREQLKNGQLTEAHLREARELLNWSREVVLCMRAHAQSRLGSLHIAQAYDSLPPAHSPRLLQRNL